MTDYYVWLLLLGVVAGLLWVASLYATYKFATTYCDRQVTELRMEIKYE